MALSLIDKQDNVQIVRDQIAAILLAEVDRQMALATAAGRDPDDWKLRIYLEASNPIEAFLNNPTDTSPIVDVWYDSDTFNLAASNLHERQMTEAIYNIDCYGYGVAEETVDGHTPGDKAASFASADAAKLVRNILMAAENTWLLLRGVVGRRYVISRNAFQPERGTDSVQKILGTRLRLSVTFNEFSPQTEAVRLNYVAIDIHRAYDGRLTSEHDFDYAAVTIDSVDTQSSGSVDIKRSLILQIDGADTESGGELEFGATVPITAATTESSGDVDILFARILQVDGADTESSGDASATRSLLLSVDGADTESNGDVDISVEQTIQIDGANTESGGDADALRSLLLSIDGADTESNGDADIISGTTLQIDGQDTESGGAVDVLRSLLLTIDGANTESTGDVDIATEQALTIDAATTESSGDVDVLRAKILQIDGQDTESGGAVDVLRSLILSIDGANTESNGDADALRSLLLSIDGQDTESNGDADALRSLILTIDGQDTESGGDMDFVSEQTITADAADTESGGAVDVIRSLLLTIDGVDTESGGEATLEEDITRWYVDPTGSGSEDGTSWDDAYGDIQSALTAATSGDEVWVKEGTYAITSAITHKAGVPLYGGFASTLSGTAGTIAGRDLVNDISTIDANSTGRIFTLSTNCATDGFTCREGDGSTGGGVALISSLTGITFDNMIFVANAGTSTSFFNGGGAFRISSSTVAFTDCVFDANTVLTGVDGGAITIANSTVTMTDCEVKNHTTARGGGAIIVDATSDVPLTLIRCDFTDNSSVSSSGGAIKINNAIVDIDDSTFDGNDATVSFGGAIVITGTRALTIEDSTFQNNESDSNGTAIYSTSETTITGTTFDNNDSTVDYGQVYHNGGNALTITDCLFKNGNNRASLALWNSGGTYEVTSCVFHTETNTGFQPSVIYCNNGTTNIQNCTIADNTHTGGHSIRVVSGTVTITNTTIWGNTETAPLIGTRTTTYSNIEGGETGTGNINSDPSFIGSGNDPYNISASSPCIDAGDGDVAPTLDYLGNARYDDPLVTNTGTGTPPYTDIGAYEYQGV
jgi:hypothetical protein